MLPFQAVGVALKEVLGSAPDASRDFLPLILPLINLVSALINLAGALINLVGAKINLVSALINIVSTWREAGPPNYLCFSRRWAWLSRRCSEAPRTRRATSSL